MPAGSAVGVSVGRVRVTRAVTPSEAGYIVHMRKQADQLGNIIQDVIDRVENATPEGILYALEPVMELSQQYVPVLKGKLKASAFQEVKQTASGAQATIGYAKHGQPHYAAFVHEMMNRRHAHGKRAKFLESAINERIHIFAARLIEFMRAKTGLKP